MASGLAFEDFNVGDVYDLAPYRVSEEEMIAFAERYDPHDFHTDPEAAKHSHFGGLISSGWLTTAIFMRMQYDGYMQGSTCMGSPGTDEIRWLQPVRPGDTLSGSNEIIEVKPSVSKPDRGVVFSKVTLRNQRDEPVMTLVTRAIYLKRSA